MATSNDSSSARVTTSKKVLITNTSGEVLVGVFDDTGSKDVVILCHGFRGTKEFFTLVHLASALGKLGVSTFRFDFSGNGESQGQLALGNYWKEVDDLHCVVQYWIGQGRSVKAIIGHSKGGAVVLLYASKYEDVSTVVNLSGRCDNKRGLKEMLGENFFQIINEEGYLDVKDKSGNIEYRVTKESLMERLNTDMKAVVQSIPNNCRVFTIHGSMDEVVPVEDAFEFDKLITNHKLLIIDGADHLYTHHQATLADAVVELFSE